MNTIVFSCVALFILLYGLISARLEKTLLSAPMVFVAFGLLIGSNGLGLLTLDTESPVLLILAELTLIVVLFTDASRIDLKLLRREHIIPKRLLFIGLPLCIVFGCIVSVIVFDGFSIWEGLILATILAPTDAALGQAVVSNPRIPVRIRQALNVESGLNDGIALPLVLLSICLASTMHTEEHTYWVVFALLQVTLGPLVGIVLGYFGGKLIQIADKAGYMTHAFRGLAILAIALSAYSIAELVHGNGFIAAFTAGLTIGNTVRDHCECLYDFAESEGQLLTLLIFMFFGTVMVVPALQHMTGEMMLYAVLSLTIIRILPAMISLLGLKLKSSTQFFLGWFGPRGVASILFALLVMEDSGVQGRHEIFTIVVLTVFLSIIAHGMTANPGAKWYAAKISAPKHNDATEHEDMEPMPTRLAWSDTFHKEPST